ncbi:MAG: hypothetical protein IKS07_00750 [Lachnospiraceae bacterium]|nr:hypothetical protein [Lachnospiraceae bacterium]
MEQMKTYKCVTLDGRLPEKSYKDPMTKTYQYEYALFAAVSELFGAVRARSCVPERLKLYFMELPESSKTERHREAVLAEMRALTERDVTGRICFPMHSACAAEVRTRVLPDGTHLFIFSDGIYGFTVRIRALQKGRPQQIEVTDLRRMP